MTSAERRATGWLASLFATRMLGLFLVLPVFALHARQLPGGDNALLVGLAFGIYGLTQGLLQIPFGAASDRYGRKPLMLIGLAVFALGSVVAAYADTVTGLLIGRALQGAGAISSVVTATLADSTRDSQRTKAMAVIGGSIALCFALSLVLSPLLYGAIGMRGLFLVIAVLAVLGMVVVWKGLPTTGTGAFIYSANPADSWSLNRLVREPNLLRLNVGVFSLHMIQMAMFTVVPGWLIKLVGLPAAEHWKMYLPALLLSLIVMMPILLGAERRGKGKQVFVASIALLIVVQLGFAFAGAWIQAPNTIGLALIAILLLLFFLGFNMLEAALPSLVSRLAPQQAKGAALGVYNTAQALGLFAGPALAGAIQMWFGEATVFIVCAVVLFMWYLVAPGLTNWPGRSNKESEESNGISQ